MTDRRELETLTRKANFFGIETTLNINSSTGYVDSITFNGREYAPIEFAELARKVIFEKETAAKEALTSNASEIKITMAEAQFSVFEGVQFKSCEQLQAFIDNMPRADVGYDKVFVSAYIYGTKKNFRYDHSATDGDFLSQAIYQITFA